MRVPDISWRPSQRQVSLTAIISGAALLFLLAAPHRKEPPPVLSPEQKFIGAVAQARNAWIDAPNPLAKQGMRAARAAALCRALPSRSATSWTGRVKTIAANALPDFDGKASARIVLELAPHITLATPSSPLFNSPEEIVERGSSIYAAAAELRPGEAVTFSGHFAADDADCMAEDSFTVDGGMRDPEFKFVLTALGPGRA